MPHAIIDQEMEQQAVRQEVDRILAHPLFRRSERMARFLRLAVERTLAGRAEELKEYLVGVEVYDRKGNYDPRVDPIVRVEARRLRAKLKAYYEGDGREDTVVIDFVSGSYIPNLRLRAATPVQMRGTAAIAVLPFVNLSASADDDYFSDGLTEALIHSLTKLEGLRVVAWSSAVQLRHRQHDIPAIRARLNVGTVLTGSVRIANARLRVRAQLIDTETGVYLWSETFDREMEDVFSIQEEMALAIVRILRVQLTGKREERPAARTRVTIGSYNWYLKGRYFAHHRTPAGLERSIQCFENALAEDPNSALAHAGLAEATSLLVDYGLVHPANGMPKAKNAANRALALAPDQAEALVSLAFIRALYDREWDEAEQLYHRAIALNPGYATAHHWLGLDHLALLGRFDEARKCMATALQLDPLSMILQEGRGYLLMLERRYEEALASFRELTRVEPAFYKGYTSMGRTLAQMGRYDEALEMLEKGRSLAGDAVIILGAMGQVYGLRGDDERARTVLAGLVDQARSSYVPSTCFALVHLGLGERDAAFDFLEAGCEARELSVAALGVHPAYDALRGEPRFDAILRRLRLT